MLSKGLGHSLIIIINFGVLIHSRSARTERPHWRRGWFSLWTWRSLFPFPWCPGGWRSRAIVGWGKGGLGVRAQWWLLVGAFLGILLFCDYFWVENYVSKIEKHVSISTWRLIHLSKKRISSKEKAEDLETDRQTPAFLHWSKSVKIIHSFVHPCMKICVHFNTARCIQWSVKVLKFYI